MAMVIDASVAAAWCFRDEDGSAQADTVMARTTEEASIVPDIFWHEMRNILTVAERKGRIATLEAERHMDRLRTLPLVTDHAQDDRETLSLTRRWNLSAYDAAYLETARRLSAGIATFDRRLAAAAANEAVSNTVD